MPESNPFRIFVSHAWQDHDDYLRLFEYLGEASNFYYENLSTPDTPPENAGNPLAIQEDLVRQMDRAEVVIILSGLYEDFKDLLELQMGIAKKHGKPIIALRPFGLQTMPEEVEERATQVVVWNERTIVDAIKLHSRGEETNRFEVIDFP